MTALQKDLVRRLENFNVPKILVLVQCCGGSESASCYLKLQRGGSDVALIGDSGGLDS